MGVKREQEVGWGVREASAIRECWAEVDYCVINLAKLLGTTKKLILNLIVLHSAENKIIIFYIPTNLATTNI